MRSLAVLALLVAAPAWADRADDLVLEGQALGKDGKLVAAIAKFREADALRPRAIHSCLIGLAYFRADVLPAAHVAFAQCRARATADDPAPDWLEAEAGQLSTRIASARLGTVTLEVAPGITAVEVAVVGDQRFAPLTTLHLPVGVHRVIGHAEDGRRVETTVAVEANGMHTVKLDLPVLQPKPSLPDLPPPAVARPRSKVPLIVAGIGGALVSGGVVLNLTKVRTTRADLDAATTNADYDRRYDDYNRVRIGTIALYAVGAAAVVTGIVLHRRSSEGPQITASVGANGGVIGLEWRR